MQGTGPETETEIMRRSRTRCPVLRSFQTPVGDWAMSEKCHEQTSRLLLNKERGLSTNAAKMKSYERE